MKRIVFAVLLVVSPLLTADGAEVGHLRNEQLSVVVFDDGSFDVRDLRNKRDYVQPHRGPAAKKTLGTLPKGFTPDGDLSEWTGKPYRISSDMLADVSLAGRY